jgi:hypothetical protein
MATQSPLLSPKKASHRNFPRVAGVITTSGSGVFSSHSEHQDGIGTTQSSPVTVQALSAFVRVRPFTEKQVLEFASATAAHHSTNGATSVDHNGAHNTNVAAHACVYRTSGTTLVVDQRVPNSTEKQMSRDLTFTFDKVFWSLPHHQRALLHPADCGVGVPSTSSKESPFSGQEQIFEDVAKPMVDLALQGFNSCVFAFGQTGSGKSYTIFGPQGGPQESHGLAPRLASYLFQSLNKHRRERNMTDAFQHDESMNTDSGTRSSSHGASLGYSYSVAVGCFELYNEKLFDLLSRAAARSARSAPSSQPMTRVNSLQAPPSPVLASTPDVSFGDDFDVDGVPSGLSPTNDSPSGAGDGGFYAAPTPATESSTISDTDDEDQIVPTSSTTTPFAALLQLQHPHHPPWPTSSSANTSTLRIRHDPVLGTYVEGLRTELVDDEDSMILLIQQALKHRLTAANHMHDVSSRSHAILTFTITQEDTIRGSRKQSTLHVVDLAGSERGARHGASGQQLAESKKINLSLTTLRRVIDLMVAGSSTSMRRKSSLSSSTSLFPSVPQSSSVGLSSSTFAPSTATTAGTAAPSNSVHLPVRDSKLTEVMSESLGGNSRTFMIATVSPHEANIHETLDSLRYCTKAKGIVNRMRPNEERIAVAVQAIQNEIDRLRTQLAWRHENSRFTEMESWLQKRAKVSMVLRASNRERKSSSASMRDRANEIDAELIALRSALNEKDRIKRVVDELSGELSLVTARNREIEAAHQEHLRHNESMRSLQREAAFVVEQLESTPLPPAVRDLLVAKKKCWRIAFITAAAEYQWQQNREAWVSQVHTLVRSCHTTELHVDVVDGLLDGESPEAMMYRRVQERLKDTSIAVGQGYEAYYRNALELRHALRLQNSEIARVRDVELREAELDVARIEAHYRPSLAQSGLLIFELQRQLDDHISAMVTADDDACNLEASIIRLLAHITNREMEMEDNRVQLMKLSARDCELTLCMNEVRPEVLQLQKDVSELTDEVDFLEQELQLLNSEIQDCDVDAQVAVKHLVDAEHATRKLCLPDATPAIADTPLANGILSVDRASHALTTPRRFLQGSMDCAARSRSQESRLPAPGSTPLQIRQFSRTPSRTPAAGWRNAAFTPTPSATRHLADIVSPRPEDPSGVLYTEDF